MINVEMAITQLYFSGILLHGFCMELIKDLLESSDGNAPEVDQ